MKWGKPFKTRHPVGFIEPCIPTVAAKVPEGPLWVHEVKHDGYRLIVRRSGDRVRLFTRRGYDWSDRYPRIVEAANRIKGAFLIDGEVVVSDEHGIADFEQLHSREHDKSAMLWAFDLLEPLMFSSKKRMAFRASLRTPRLEDWSYRIIKSLARAARLLTAISLAAASNEGISLKGNEREIQICGACLRIEFGLSINFLRRITIATLWKIGRRDLE